LAPAVVEFYSQDWRRIGTKSSLVDDIQRATGIEKKFLLDRRNVKLACVGKKFGWASHRQTTRIEDIAYSLLGLVDVNMPMLYGEGPRAFYRLQLEIIKQTQDHTIFVWGPHSNGYYEYGATGFLPRDVHEIGHWGMLAPSPSWFGIHREQDIHPWLWYESTKQLTHEMTSMGLRMTLPCAYHPFGVEREIEAEAVCGMFAFLNCRTSKGNCIAIRLIAYEDGRHARLVSNIRLLNDKQPYKTTPIDIVVEAETLQKSSSALESSTMRVGSLRIWDFPQSLVGEAALISWFFPYSFDCITEIPNILDVLEHDCVIQDRCCGAFRLRIDDTAIAIIFGCHQHFTFLKLSLYESQTEFERVLMQSNVDMLAVDEGHETEFLRDQLEEEICGIGLNVFAKKTLLGPEPCWRLMIEIWAAANGRPDKSSADREYLGISPESLRNNM
jgi:hypothetical protein